MRKMLLICACCVPAWLFSYSPPPASSWLPSLGVSHASAQFYGHQRRVARRVYRRGYRRAARYGAYVAGTAAGYYGYPYGYGYGGYGVYGTPGMYRRAYRRAYY